MIQLHRFLIVLNTMYVPCTFGYDGSQTHTSHFTLSSTVPLHVRSDVGGCRNTSHLSNGKV